VGWFKQRGRYSSTPHVGDLVYYGAGGGTHVELVVGVAADTIQTIGGNTSGSVGGRAFFNGNGVYEKTVRRTSRIHGYGRPDYSSGAATTGTAGTGTVTPRIAAKPLTTVRTVRRQQEAVNALGHEPKLDVDGEWGPKTAAGVKWLQKKVGADVDGEWGAATEKLFVAFGARAPAAAAASTVPAAAAAATTTPAEPAAATRPAAAAGATRARTRVKPITTSRTIRQQQEAVNSLGYEPKLDVDGEWGPKTETGVKWLQKKIGADGDGEWGADTERLFVAFVI
jgi:peptidoglycan hydrolase-like protein with peptidoglycan-binding domain